MGAAACLLVVVMTGTDKIREEVRTTMAVEEIMIRDEIAVAATAEILEARTIETEETDMEVVTTVNAMRTDTEDEIVVTEKETEITKTEIEAEVAAVTERGTESEVQALETEEEKATHHVLTAIRTQQPEVTYL
jgi:hypothetical protein